MKRLMKKEIFFRIVLISLLIILVTIPAALFLLQPGANLQAMFEEILKHDDNDDNKAIILGIGLYKPSGTAINRVGSAPQYVFSTEISSEPIVDGKDKSLKLIHDIGHLDNSSGGGHIYIEFDIREMLTRFRSFQLIAFIIIIIISTLFIVLYRKNQNYRKKIESQEQLVQLGEIARTLSHEIKNPLGAIRMQTGYLRRLLPTDDNNKAKIERLSIIEEEVQRLALLTNRIGDFLRDPAGTPIKIELHSFMNEMIKRFDWQIHLNMRPENRANVLADVDRLRSVVENLLRNAIESMDDSPEKVPVEVVLSSDGKKVILSILDRGSGLSKEQKKRAFDPFFTNKTKGSGIGLFVSRRFIEAAGGSLSLHPRKHGGTEARIVFNKVEEK
ncbi:MAG: HAMP domain-containing sensor histidine kinase [Spirochaetia bacterium]|jgi:signal transduction histidine kinase|nr:HAMP domain-containing sensor histidine kinase [Spirochaetia bacterium]